MQSLLLTPAGATHHQVTQRSELSPGQVSLFYSLMKGGSCSSILSSVRCLPEREPAAAAEELGCILYSEPRLFRGGRDRGEGTSDFSHWALQGGRC